MKHLTHARPYAKAIFALALAEPNNAVYFTLWQQALDALVAKKFAAFQQILLSSSSVAPQISEQILNFIKLLEENHRLNLLPTIAQSYKLLVLKQQQILPATIISTRELTEHQKSLLLNTLEKRYQQKILATYLIDQSILGGLVIHIANQVIDYSAKEALCKLQKTLQYSLNNTTQIL